MKDPTRLALLLCIAAVLVALAVPGFQPQAPSPGVPSAPRDSTLTPATDESAAGGVSTPQSVLRASEAVLGWLEVSYRTDSTTRYSCRIEHQPAESVAAWGWRALAAIESPRPVSSDVHEDLPDYKAPLADLNHYRWTTPNAAVVTAALYLHGDDATPHRAIVDDLLTIFPVRPDPHAEATTAQL